jgi:putative transposase
VSAAKREGVAHLRAVMGLSERRACALVSADHTMIRYSSRRSPDRDRGEQIRDLANARKRFGYRRLFILLRQAGEPSGVNRIYWLYREAQILLLIARLLLAIIPVEWVEEFIEKRLALLR